MNIEIATYLCYLGISIALTVWVAHTLHKNGRIFLLTFFTATSRWPTQSIICW